MANSGTGIESGKQMSKEEMKRFQKEQQIIIGNRLRGLREGKMSQKEVAEFLGLATQGAYGKLESGDVALQPQHCVKLADLFGVSCDYILRGIEAENVDVCKRTGLTNETVRALTQREKLSQDWKKTEEYHEKEYRRLCEKLNAEGYTYDVDPYNPDFEKSLEHEDAQWEARFERENCLIYNYLVNAILNDAKLWEILVQASEQACRNVKELYARTVYNGKKAYNLEVENNENAINAAKYIAGMAFSKFFDATCNDIGLIACTGFTPVHEEDAPEEFKRWLDKRNNWR